MIDSDALFSGLPFVIFVAALGAMLLAVTQQHRDTLRVQLTLFLVALLVRFSTSVVIYDFGLVEILKDEDASDWISGLELARQWARFNIGIFDLPSVLVEAYQHHNRGYFYLLGAAYTIWDFGSPSRYIAAGLNCFFGAMTVVFVYRTANTLFGPLIAGRVGWWVCFFPSLVIWSAQTLKEPVVIFLETVALYAAVQLARRGLAVRYLAAAAAAILLIMPFRFYAAYVAGGAVIIALAFGVLRSNRLPLRPLIGTVAAVLAISVLAGVAAQNEIVQGFDVGYVSKVRYYFAEDTGSGVQTTYDIGTTTGFTMATVVGALHVLFAPFPWDWVGGSGRLLLTVPEVVVWWWLFFYGVVPGIRYAFKARFAEIQPVLVLIIGFGFLYSLVFGNVGLAYRQRAQIIPWLLIFAAVGLEQRWAKRRAAREARYAAVPSRALTVRP